LISDDEGRSLSPNDKVRFSYVCGGDWQATENGGILIELTGYKRNRLFACDDYIKLFR